MRAARGSQDTDQIGATAEFGGPRLEPADRVVDIGQRGRVGRPGGHAEIERRHDHAASRQRLVDHRVVQAVASAPGTAVQLDHEREGTRGTRPEETGQQRLRPMADIFDVVHVELASHGCGRHLWAPMFNESAAASASASWGPRGGQ